MFPIIFETKYIILHTIWIFLAAAIIVGAYLLVKLSIKNSLKLQFLSDNTLKILICALIGARILGIIENYDIYFSDFTVNSLFQLLYVWDLNLSIWGAVAGALTAFYLLCKKNEQDFWKWLDIIVPALLVVVAIRNLGNFFDGDAYGKETSLPWGVNFENPAVKYTVPVHPTQIYSFLYSLILGIVLIYLPQIKRIQEVYFTGFIGLAGSTIFWFLKFLEEFVRGDDVLMIFGLRVPQILALLLCIGSGIIFFLRYNRREIINK